MATIVTRAGKGSPLTHAELDANFTNLNSAKAEKDANNRIPVDGVVFPSTPAPSADPRTLDYYVEGTFTPKIEGSTTAGTGTYTAQSGFYTRIGNVVFFQILLSWSAHTGAGDIRVMGLPFAASSSANRIGVSNIIGSALTFSGQIAGLTLPGTDRIDVVSSTSGASFAGVPMDAAATLRISGAYAAA